jgi:transposase InsO family protein
MAETFVNTIKRHYVAQAVLSGADTVLAQVSAWINDYNHVAPHSALGQLSPRDFRAQQYRAPREENEARSSNLCV